MVSHTGIRNSLGSCPGTVGNRGGENHHSLPRAGTQPWGLGRSRRVLWKDWTNTGEVDSNWQGTRKELIKIAAQT